MDRDWATKANHSHREKKMGLPVASRALLIFVYLPSTKRDFSDLRFWFYLSLPIPTFLAGACLHCGSCRISGNQFPVQKSRGFSFLVLNFEFQHRPSRDHVNAYARALPMKRKCLHPSPRSRGSRALFSHKSMS